MNLSFFLLFKLYIKQCLTVKKIKENTTGDGMYCESLLANQNLDITTFGNYQKRKKKKMAVPGMCYITILFPYYIEASASLLFTWTICNLRRHKNISNLVSIMTDNSLNVIKCDIFNGLLKIFITYKSIRIKLICKSIVWWGIIC